MVAITAVKPEPNPPAAVALEQLLDGCAALARQGANPCPHTARMVGEHFDRNAARLRELAETAAIETAGRP